MARTARQIRKDLLRIASSLEKTAASNKSTGTALKWKADKGRAAIKKGDYIVVSADTGDTVDSVCAAAALGGLYAYWSQDKDIGGDYTIIVSKTVLKPSDCTEILRKNKWIED